MAAYPIYLFNMKSEEQLAASSMNAIRIGLSATEDVSTFATNLENIFQAYVAGITLESDYDYSLPYPAGTGTQWRMVCRDAAAHVQVIVLYDISDTAVAQTVAANLVSAGMLLYPWGTPVTSIVVTSFTPGGFTATD